MRADRAALIEFTEQWANDCPDEPRFRQIVAALQLTPLDQEEQIAHDAELFEAGLQHGIKHYPFGAAPVAALGAAPWQGSCPKCLWEYLPPQCPNPNCVTHTGAPIQTTDKDALFRENVSDPWDFKR